MSRSEKQPKTKRAKAWACVLDADVVCIHHSKAAAADCSRAGTSRPARLVERLPGDVVLSRGEMRKIRSLAREVPEGQVLEWRKKPPVAGCTNCGGKGVYSWEDGHNGDEHESPCDCAREPALKGGDVRRILRGRR